MKEENEIWRQALLPEQSTIGQVIQRLDRIAIKIVLIVNKNQELVGTISDGDIRRGLLKGYSLNSPIEGIIHRNSLVVPREMPRDVVVQLMMTNRIHQIPVVDENKHVVGLHLWDQINSIPQRPNIMVIMAGGKGTRLRPFTENCPKPLVSVSGKPMLEHIIDRGKREGFNHFVLAIQHLGHMIEDYFSDGRGLGVRIDYLREKFPMGTAGALGLLNPRPDIPFIVTNGDVLTDIRYGELLDFHDRYRASATMAVRIHEWQHPYGVVQTAGVEIVGFEEKPIARSHINAGVYAISPEALDDLSLGESSDMPTLFQLLQAKGRRTVAYPMHEPWLDVGRPDDLAVAQSHTSKDRV